LIYYVAQISNIPFVVHGASGMGDEEIHRLSQIYNVRKINISTEVKLAYRKGILLLLNNALLQCVCNPFYEMVNVLGSFFMAKDFLHADFVYLHADTLCAPEIFMAMLEVEGDIILSVDYSPWDEVAMKVKATNGKVVEINKTMDCKTSEGEFIGIT